MLNLSALKRSGSESNLDKAPVIEDATVSIMKRCGSESDPFHVIYTHDTQSSLSTWT